MPSPTISLIAAVARHGAIGRDNQLLFRIPGDLPRLKRLTLGHPVIMGRKTWDSLPERFRPLPGRRNVVLSTTLDAAEGAEVARSVDEVLAAGHGELWVIGGAGVYEAFLPHADEVVVTEVDGSFPGDTVAPRLDDGWTPGLRLPDDGWLGSTSGLRYRVTWWRRAGATSDDVPARMSRWLADVGRPAGR